MTHLTTPRISRDQACIVGRLGVVIGAGWLLMFSEPAAAQTPAIAVSATSAATAAPGGSVTVSVTVGPNAAIVKALVGGFDQLRQVDTFPAEVAFEVPPDVQLGAYFVNAVGLTATGQEFKAEPLMVYVERSDQPVGLAVERSPLVFPHAGVRQPLLPIARFGDGSRLEIRESPRLGYSTTNAAVATVDSSGIVTAVSSGEATISVDYRTNSQMLRASVPVSVGRTLLEASPASLEFGTQPVGVASTRSFTLRNLASAPLTIFGITSTPEFAVAGACVTSSTLAPNASCDVSVTFAPIVVGQRRANIKIANEAFNPPLGVSATGEGLGLRASATTFGSSANPSVLGQPITLTATVTDATGASSPVPSGDVAFSAPSSGLGSATLAGGTASAAVSSLGVGSHALSAAYSGDSAYGPSTSAALTHVVRYAGAGTTCVGQPGHQILQPVNADGTSVFRQGRTVPATFRVCNAAGQSIGTPGVVQDFRLTQVITGTTSAVNETVPSTTPDTAFRWDAAAAQWIFNISTAGQQAQRTYVYTITLNDGTTIGFRYGLR